MSTKILYSGPTGTVSTSVPDSIKMAEKLVSEGGFVGPGTVPIGSVVAIADTRAWPLPASSEINEGWAICDGAAFPAGSHPSLTGNRPNLRDERFIQGNTFTGSPSGDNNRSLEASLGDIDFSHGHKVDNHWHNYKHVHMWSANYSSGNRYMLNSQYQDSTTIVSGNQSWVKWLSGDLSPSGIDDIGEAGPNREDSNSYTTGVNSGVNGTGANANTGGSTPNTNSVSLKYSAGHSHKILNSSGANTTDIRPKYINAVYLIRVI